MTRFPGAISIFPGLALLWGPTNEPFPGRHGLGEQLRFLGEHQQPLGALWLSLGDHLVTMGVQTNPWGAV